MPARPEHAPDVAQRAMPVRDQLEHERAQRQVEGLVVERRRSAVATVVRNRGRTSGARRRSAAAFAWTIIPAETSTPSTVVDGQRSSVAMAS